jgi:hypothetical protein
MFIFLTTLGLISGYIAYKKNRSFIKWFIYGFFLGIIAIVHALIIKNGKKCPECCASVDMQAKVCKHCRYKFIS